MDPLNKEFLLKAIEEAEEKEEEIKLIKEKLKKLNVSKRLWEKIEAKEHEIEEMKYNATKAILILLRGEGKI